MDTPPDVGSTLLPLVDHRHVVELIDTLAVAPATQAQLRSALQTSRRRLRRALRVLAAHGLVQRQVQRGTWDAADPAPVRYVLTDAGREVTEHLDQLDVWVAIYEQFLYGPPHDEPS